MTEKETASPSQQMFRQLADSWIDEFNYYETNMESCEMTLEEFIHRIQKGDGLARVEQFQNQFVRQKEVINDLKHRIRLFFQWLEPGQDITEPEGEYFAQLDAEVDLFRNLFSAMLSDFDRFIDQLESAPPKG